MTENDKQALEVAMKVMGRDRKWGPALLERLDGTRYENPANGEWILEFAVVGRGGTVRRRSLSEQIAEPVALGVSAVAARMWTPLAATAR